MTKISLARPVIVFDLDGTLIDTAPDLANTLNVILTKTGRPEVSESEVRPWVGRGAKVMLRRAIEKAGDRVDDAEIEALFADYLVHYSDHIADRSRPFPGLIDLLDRLAGAGARLGVCTNKREALAVKLLNELDMAQRFGTIVGADTLPVSKPDPAPLHHAIEALGGSSGRAIMVGDSITDRDTARAAGVPVVLVSFGYTETPAAELAPDALIHHFDEFWPAMEGLDG